MVDQIGKDGSIPSRPISTDSHNSNKTEEDLFKAAESLMRNISNVFGSTKKLPRNKGASVGPSWFDRVKTGATSFAEKVTQKKTNAISTKSAYSTAIVANDNEVDAILGEIISNNKKAQINYIPDLDSLSDSNLSEEYIIEQNNVNDTPKLTERKGSLFCESQELVILVIDYRYMNIDTIVGFNSLYDRPPTLYGKQLSSNVKIVSIVEGSLSSKDGPGEDFWRRVLHTENYIGADSEEYLNKSTYFNKIETDIVKKVDKVESQDKDSLVIKLSGENWRNELFGHLDLDGGQLCYTQGKLANLKKNQKIYFQDAPWYDKNFSLAIKKMIDAGGYTANGKFINFETGIKFFHCKTDLGDIKSLQNKFKWNFTEDKTKLSEPGKIKILNQNLFFYYTQKAAIKDGKLVKRDVFKEWINDKTSVIKVTTKLSSNQWNILLAKLEKIGRTDITIIQDNPDEQPTDWKHENDFNQKHNIISKNVRVLRNDMGLIPEVLTKNKQSAEEPLDIQLSTDSSINKLTSKVKSISLENRFFDMENTEFVRALESGKPINIYGLEYNPKLPLELESLLGNPPFLMIDGFCKILPKANITFHLPNTFTAPTNLWGKLIDNATEVYQKSLQTTKKEIVKKYAADVPVGLSRKVFDEIIVVTENINNVRRTSISPQNKILTHAVFMDKIWTQAIVEWQEDGVKKINKSHFMKALNSIMSKRYREDAENYRYIKFLITSNFSNEPATIDLVGLKHWVRKQKTITKELIQENFWLLSQYIPYKHLSLQKTRLQQFLSIFTLANIKDFFTINNLIARFKSLAQSAFNLVKNILMLPLTILKKVVDLIAYCYKTISNIIQHKENIVYDTAVDKEDKPKISLRDSAIASNEALDFITATIVSCIEDEKEQEKIQQTLEISNEKMLEHQNKINKYTNNCYQIEKILRDICYTVDSNTLDNKIRSKVESHGYQKLCHDLSIDITKKVLLLEQTETSQQEEARAITIKEISEKLRLILPDEEQEEIEAMAADLLLCTTEETLERFWKYWYERRKQRCADKVKAHSFTMIKGPAGSGKSYMAKEVAMMLNPNEKPITINVKANMSPDDIYGTFKLEQQELKYVKGELRKWAENKEDGYHTIILDEFTFSDELWDSLRTMLGDPPYINIDGEKLYLTDKHRIIMTSNPDHFKGRKANKILTMMMAEMFYLPLSDGFQKEQIVTPEINAFIDRIKFSDDIKLKKDSVNKIATCVYDLYLQYTKIIPANKFTPRDLTDCCSRIEAYFSDYITNKNKDDINLEMIYSVVRQSMKESVSNGLSDEYTMQLEAIDIWHKARFLGNEKIVLENEAKFNDFYDNLELFLRKDKSEQYQKFDLNNTITKNLCRKLFFEYRRSNLEKQTNVIHRGRHGVLIEGPPGLGKDTVIAIINKFWKDKYDKSLTYENITANVKATNTIMEKIKNKHTNGGILSVAELNAYDTQSIEGNLNDLLTDSPGAPGFLFLATANSAKTTRGRSEFSPALLSRFAKNMLQEHTYKDLNNICKTRVKNENIADLITQIHWKVRSQMKKAERNALPSIADIEKVVEAICKYDKSLISSAGFSKKTKESVAEIIQSNYIKYLKLLNWDNKKINEFFSTDIINDESLAENNYMPELTAWINQQTTGNLNAIVVSKGIVTHYNTTTGILTLSANDYEKKNTDEQKKIILNTINTTLAGIAKQTVIAETEDKIEDEIEDKIEDEIEIENKHEILESTAVNRDNVSSIAFDVVETSSSNNIVDKDVEKLVNSTKDVERYELVNNTNIANRALSTAIGLLDREKELLSYFTPKPKPISGWLALKHLNDFLSDHSYFDYILSSTRQTQSRITHKPSLYFPASKERTNLVKKAIAELESSTILQQQLKSLCIQHKQNLDRFWRNLKLLEESTYKLSSYAESEIKTFDILSEINGSACGILSCAALNFRESIPAVDTFIKIISKGYINYNTAIKFIENNNTILIRRLASRFILKNCCKTLNEGKNIENLSKIIIYLMDRDGDYFDSTSINSIIEISKFHNLEDLSNKAKKVLQNRYNHALNKKINLENISVSLSKYKEKYDSMHPGAKEQLSNIFRSNMHTMLKKDTEIKEKRSWNVSNQVDIPSFVSRKPPFKEPDIKYVTANDIYITGTPVINRLRLSAIFYHEPTNKIINLSSLIFDENGNIQDFSAEKAKEYLSNQGIQVDYKLTRLCSSVATLIKNTFEKQQKKQERTYKPGDIFSQLEDVKYELLTKKINEYLVEYNLDKNWSYLSSASISRLETKEMLVEAGKINYFLKFCHSSSAGVITAKKSTDLAMVEEYVNDVTKYSLFQRLDNTPNSNIMHYETEEIKKQVGDKAIVINQQDREDFICKCLS